jgi:hypothetical protein
MEAVGKIEVEDFPAFIVIDDKGNDVFADTSAVVIAEAPSGEVRLAQRTVRGRWPRADAATPRRRTCATRSVSSSIRTAPLRDGRPADHALGAAWGVDR